MRRWFALVLLAVLLLPASALSTGSLTIPHTIFTQPGGTNVAPLLDQNNAAIASYINTREVTFGLLSARPVAGVAGRFYFATDQNGGTFYGDNGVSWSPLSAGVQANIVQQLTGLGLANNGTATATFTIGVGAATSDDAVVTNRVLISNTVSLTKRLTAWAVGSGTGCLDAGAVATFTWYHVFAIERLDTGAVDAVCSTSATAPVLPTNYTKKRRIGSIRTAWDAAASISFFLQDGNTFVWATPTLDFANGTPGGGSTLTATVATPNGVRTTALLNVGCGNLQILLVFPTGQPNFTPSVSVAPLSTCSNNGGDTTAQAQVLTDTLSQVSYSWTVNNPIRFMALGWIDRRGQQ